MKKINLNWWNINIVNKKNKANLFKAFKNKKFTQGSVCEILEEKVRKKINAKHALLTPNGSSALLLALIYFKQLKPSKTEVLISNRSWIAPAHAAYVLGLKLKFVDVKKDYPMPDEKQIIKKINNKTLCVICVQLNGRSVDVTFLKKKCKDVFLLEDSAQSFFSKTNEKFIGTNGHAGILSFSMGKIVSSGQGGALITNDSKMFHKLKLIKNHGIINRYTDKWGTFGFNFKFTDIQASILLNQIDNLENTKKKLLKLYNYYKKKLEKNKNIKLIDEKLSKGQIPLYIECYSTKKLKIINLLKKYNVYPRVNYPSLHTTKYFKKFLKKNENFPNSKKFEKYSFYLPSGPDQSQKKISEMLKIINSKV